MITRDELLVQAKAFDLSEANVQRDYVFGWIISGIFRESNLADWATLKGGNALRKGYLPGTRFSDDLDFSTPDRLDGDGVLAELNRVCDPAKGQQAGETERSAEAICLDPALTHAHNSLADFVRPRQRWPRNQNPLTRDSPRP